MTAYERKGDWWPTPQQELLLKAALLEGDQALEAWERWRAATDITRLDQGSHRMLPLLYRNLQKHAVKDPLMEKLKGVYRHTWYKNQMLFSRAAAILRSFQEAGIEVMILKGTALALLHYKDAGLRPMNDFDVLVRPKQSRKAIDLLKRLGWSPKEAFAESFVSIKNGFGFQDGAGQEFDLHWHVLSECLHETADDDFWRRAVPMNLLDLSACALDPTDQLLHICVHGARWNPMPPLRWAADATAIMRSSPSEIDWNRLAEQAEERRLIQPLNDTLGYLKSVLDAPLPQDLLDRLRNMRVSKIERLEYMTKTHKQEGLGAMPMLSMYYLWYARLMKGRNLAQKIFGVPRFLQRIWNIEHLWQVPFYAATKLIRRVRKAGKILTTEGTEITESRRKFSL